MQRCFLKGSPKILARVPEFMTCGLQARLGESSAGIDEKPSLVTPSVHTRAVGGECSLQVAAVSLSSDFWDLSQGLKPPRQSKHFPFPALEEKSWDRGREGPWKSHGNRVYPSACPPVDPAEKL